ncbi:MAG: type II toxin-antitoxin system VapC family toxin [Actinomycetota bacterium]|nr:type II toxin-antitoxin system VapC family toxin [Actinomycetota bacterium]
MIVVDTSAFLEALIGRPPPEPLQARLLATSLHAPQVVDLEFLQVLRRLTDRGGLARSDAEQAREDFAALPIDRYAHTVLAERIWALRHNLTAYDAAYVALSEALDAPLITADVRIARAAGHRARVEVFALS